MRSSIYRQTSEAELPIYHIVMDVKICENADYCVVLLQNASDIQYESTKPHLREPTFAYKNGISKEIHLNSYQAKEKYRWMFEIQKSGDKTSSGEIDLDIRTHASPKKGQDQVSGGVSVLCWHAAPAYVLWKPCTIRQKVKFGNKVQISNGQNLV